MGIMVWYGCAKGIQCEHRDVYTYRLQPEAEPCRAADTVSKKLKRSRDVPPDDYKKLSCIK